MVNPQRTRLPAARDSKKRRRSTLRGRFVAKILRAIFSGELRGGDRLVESELAAKLGVSRTPIRETLGEIAAIGLIRLKPNHGAVVSPFGPSELREIYQVRRILEAEATRMAANNIDVHALRDIARKTQDLLAQKERDDAWSEAALTLDRRFHDLISRSAGSERLAREIGKYGGLVCAVGDAVGNRLQAHEQNLAEHAVIIDCLLAHNADAAAAAMSHHIDRGAETAAEFLRLKYAAERE